MTLPLLPRFNSAAVSVYAAERSLFYDRAALFNGDAFWAICVSDLHPHLTELVSKITQTLYHQGLELLTKSAMDYFPHFTAARIKRMPEIIDFAAILANDVIGSPMTCRVTIGECDEMGQFIKPLDGAV